MNLFSFINRAVHDCHSTEVARESERARKQWLDALTSDEIRAWLSLDQHDSGLLLGIGMGLSAAALAAAHDAGTEDIPDVRVIRGALSAIEQAGHNGSRIEPDMVRAVSSAATRARDVLTTCSHDAIYKAAVLVKQAYALTIGKQTKRTAVTKH